MPQVVVAAAVGSAVATGIAVATGTVAVAAAATFFATTFATTLVLGVVSQALTPSPKIPSLNFSGTSARPITGTTLEADQTVSVRQGAAPHRIIYGKTRVGGVIVYMDTPQGQLRTLIIIIAIAGHEIDSIERFFWNESNNEVQIPPDQAGSSYGAGEEVYQEFAANQGRFTYKTGLDNQTTFTQALERRGYIEWGEDHRLQGIACSYIELTFSTDVFPNGVPNFSFLVKGRKVYDPRTETTVWSANPALCLADYLTNTKFGLGVDYATEIDEAALIAAANICDEDINLSGGGTEKRYELHGAFDTDSAPEDIINSMLTAMAGRAVYTGGKWRIIAGAYYTPELTFDEDDLRAPLKIQTKVTRRENFNVIKGKFSSVLDNYIVTDFPVVRSETYITQDNGEEVIRDIELPFTVTASMAQRLAKIELERSRRQITLLYPAKLSGLKANVGDVIQINNTRFGWTNKTFEVIGVTLQANETFGVDLELREVDSNVFAWTSAEQGEFAASPTTNLVAVTDITAPGLTVTDELRIVNQQVATVLVATVTSSDPYADYFEVEYKLSTETVYKTIASAKGEIFEVPFVEDGVIYDVRARAVNVLGARSAFTSQSHQTVGQTAPPTDVTDFSINIIGTEAHLTWTPVTDLDLSHYIIRHSRLTTGAIYSQSITIADKISRPGNSAVVPAMTGTYFIKAIDKSGLESLSAAASVAIIDAIPYLNLVQTLTQQPTFAGSKTDCVVYESSLILDSDVLFDDKAGLFDDAEGLFDFAGGGFLLNGTYDFSTVVDLGAVYTSRVTAIVELSRIDVVNSFDSALGLFDGRDGLFDGDADNFGDVNVELYVSTTPDNPAGSPTWSDYRRFVVGDYKARGIRFRANLTSTNANVTPQLTTLEVTVDMPERMLAGNDIASGTDAGGKVVTYARAFKESPALSIAAQNLTSGDYYEIVSKSAGGFTIRFKDSGGTVVSRTFDYVAQGYGEFISA